MTEPQTMEVTIKSGTYNLLCPVGILGIEQMSMILEAINIQDLIRAKKEAKDTTFKMEDGMGDINFAALYKRWSIEILPKIIISGPYTFETIPAGDAFQLFTTLIRSTSESVDTFQ